MLRLPPISPLFPYTTLFRSELVVPRDVEHDVDRLRAALCGDVDEQSAFERHGRRTVRLLDRRVDHELGLVPRSEEHTSELQSLRHLVCRLLLEKKKKRRCSSVIKLTTTMHSTYRSRCNARHSIRHSNTN